MTSETLKLVPIKPTSTMVKVGWYEQKNYHGAGVKVNEAYKAMIKAAPDIEFYTKEQVATLLEALKKIKQTPITDDIRIAKQLIIASTLIAFEALSEFKQQTGETK